MQHDLEDEIKDLITEICALLHDAGYTEVPVGPLMQILGASTDDAAGAEDRVIVLDSNFERILEEKRKNELGKSSITLH